MKAKNIALVCIAALALNCSKGKVGGLIDGEANYNGGKVSTISTPLTKDTTKQEFTLYRLGTQNGFKTLNKDNIYMRVHNGWAWQKTGTGYEGSKKIDEGDGRHLAVLDNDTLNYIQEDSLYFALTDAPIGYFRIKQ